MLELDSSVHPRKDYYDRQRAGTTGTTQKDNMQYELLARTVTERARDREVVSWGFDSDVLAALGRAGLQISKVFTVNEGLMKTPRGYVVQHPRGLKGKGFFVVFPCTYGIPGAIRNLNRWGYSEVDFAVLRPVIDESWPAFSDALGNVVSTLPANVRVNLEGVNNRIHIADGVAVTSKLNITVRSSNNELVIGSGSRFKGGTNNIRINGIHGYDAGSIVRIGENITWVGTNANVGGGATLEIGSGSGLGAGTRINLSNWCQVKLGDDCMVSTDVVFQANDGHSIFDVRTRTNINSDPVLRSDGF